jgi:LPS O-antigen subunit length determinant protein (WzzB/FepE family)
MNPATSETNPSTNMVETVDPEMLKNLNFLINYDTLESEDLWDEFVKNFSELEKSTQQKELELESENQ